MIRIGRECELLLVNFDSSGITVSVEFRNRDGGRRCRVVNGVAKVSTKLNLKLGPGAYDLSKWRRATSSGAADGGSKARRA